jgi:RND family efflux transporter MFP subunit
MNYPSAFAAAKLFTVVAAFGVAAFVWIEKSPAKESALVKSALAAPSAPRPILAEGRLVTYPGKQVVVGSELAGPLKRLLVAEKTVVKKGDLIAEISVDEQRASLNEIRARVKEAAVDVDFAGTELDRTSALHRENALPKAALDRAEREQNAASARRQVASAGASRLETVIHKAAIRAPIDGVVLAKHAEEGEIIGAGARLVTIADVRALRIEAEVDEFDGGRVTLGQPVAVWAEGYDGRYRGEVEEIPDEVISRRIKPQDPGRPTDTRVLAVKIKLLEPTPLRLGQRVELEIKPASASSQLTQNPAK